MDVTKIKKVMIMAGGTGGHVMPALAVARYLQAQQVAVHWLGTRAGIEARLIEQANIPISYITIQAIRRQGWRSWLLGPYQIARAIWQSYFIIKRESPDVILSMGGYVSGPGAIAGWLQRKRLVVHEQNAIAGWTNRVLAPFASQIMVAFPKAFSSSALSKKISQVGNPVRQEIMDLPNPQHRFAQKTTADLHVLILGGSQGASILNETVPQALALLPQALRPKVWHQTGKTQVEQTRQHYQQAGIEAKINDFIDDISLAYAWADVVICRSGALTIAELCAAGIANILIPFPHAVDDHQTANAHYLSEQQAGILLNQSQLSALVLSELLLHLIQNPEQRLNMANACRALAMPAATKNVAQHCLEVTCG